MFFASWGPAYFTTDDTIAVVAVDTICDNNGSNDDENTINDCLL